MMENKNTFIKSFFLLNAFIYSFFIFNVVVYPAEIETNLRVDSGCCYDLNQAEIDLVFSEKPGHNSTTYQFNSSAKQIADSALAKVDFLALNKNALIHYNNYVLHQLKLFKRPITPQPQLLSILQKSNIWHQSSDEDSPPGS
jgi:hypothetical protein